MKNDNYNKYVRDNVTKTYKRSTANKSYKFQLSIKIIGRKVIY